MNPVKAGIVVNPEEYRWSSYQYYALGKENSLITENLFYTEIGKDEKERQNNFKKLVVDQTVSDHLDRIDSIAVGSNNFIYNANRKAKYHEVNKNTPYRKRGI